MSAFARTLRKSLENRFERASRASHAAERFRTANFQKFQSAKMTPEVPLGRLGGLSGAPLGPFWSSTWPSWRALGGSLAASGPLFGGLDSFLATLLDPKSRNFACWGHFGIPFGSLGLRLASKSCENVPRACEIIAKKTCQQRRASNVGIQQGCGGRAKRTQSAEPLVYEGSEAF